MSDVISVLDVFVAEGHILILLAGQLQSDGTRVQMAHIFET